MIKWQATNGNKERVARQRHQSPIQWEIALYRAKTNTEH